MNAQLAIPCLLGPLVLLVASVPGNSACAQTCYFEDFSDPATLGTNWSTVADCVPGPTCAAAGIDFCGAGSSSALFLAAQCTTGCGASATFEVFTFSLGSIRFWFDNQSDSSTTNQTTKISIRDSSGNELGLRVKEHPGTGTVYHQFYRAGSGFDEVLATDPSELAPGEYLIEVSDTPPLLTLRDAQNTPLLQTSTVFPLISGDIVLDANEEDVCFDWIEICTVAQFRRGDANNDRQLDIGDPIFLLAYSFVSGPVPPCMDAGDANDDGSIDIGDPISLLAYSFSGGPAPPVPFPLCGPDPTPDSLGCLGSNCP